MRTALLVIQMHPTPLDEVHYILVAFYSGSIYQWLYSLEDAQHAILIRMDRETYPECSTSVYLDRIPDRRVLGFYRLSLAASANAICFLLLGSYNFRFCH